MKKIKTNPAPMNWKAKFTGKPKLIMVQKPTTETVSEKLAKQPITTATKTG